MARLKIHLLMVELTNDQEIDQAQKIEDNAIRNRDVLSTALQHTYQ